MKFSEECRTSCNGNKKTIEYSLLHQIPLSVVVDFWDDRNLPLLRSTTKTLYSDKIGLSHYNLECCSSVKGTSKSNVKRTAPTISTKTSKKNSLKNQCPENFVVGSCCYQSKTNNKRTCEDGVDCEYCKWKNGIWNDGKMCEERISLKDSLCCETCLRGKTKKAISGNVKFRSRAKND